jgi:hypothetical protein
VQNFRGLQGGQVLLWIALPQLVIAFPWPPCGEGQMDVRCWRSAVAVQANVLAVGAFAFVALVALMRRGPRSIF